MKIRAGWLAGLVLLLSCGTTSAQTRTESGDRVQLGKLTVKGTNDTRKFAVYNNAGTAIFYVDTSAGTVVAAGGITLGALTANSFLYANNSGTLTSTAAATNGQLLIGRTGDVPLAATLTAGTGITVTNGAGTITIAAAGSGTVTSVAMTVPTQLAVAGSPITTSGTLAVTWNNQTANTVLSGPTTGAAAAPTFRALVSDDIPALDTAKITTGTLGVARGGTAVTALSDVLGTTNQVTVTGGTARVIGGAVTLSLPQSIHTTATPNFTGIITSGATAVQADPYGINPGNTGSVRFVELAANGTNYVGFQGPDSIAANLLWKLPSSDGTNGQVLSTNGSSTLSWVTAGGGSAALSGLTAATAANSINNADFAQVWNWQVTTASKIALRLSENAASTGASAVILQVDTLAASTASPLKVRALATPSLEVNSSGHTVIGGGATASELRFMEPSGSGTNYIALKAAAAAADLTFTLPVADGSSGQTMTTNASGVLTFGTLGVAGGGTGATTLTTNGVVYGAGTSAVLATAQGGANTVLTANAGAPSFSAQPTLNTGIITKGQNAHQLDPFGAAAGNTSEIRFLELAASGVNYVGFKAPDAIGVANPIWTLPSADGTNGQVLSTNGSSVLSWASGGAALSAITAAVGTNTISNGDNAQTWQWSLSTAVAGLTINESVASTSVGSYLVQISGAAGSTAHPLIVLANGNETFRVDLGEFVSIGGGISANGQLRIYETGGINFTSFTAQTMAANVTYILPAAQGGANQALINNGSGVLSWGTVSTGPANPTATIGLTAVNGTATTFLRSDGAPALSQSIAPTWTGLHIFNPGTTPSNVVLVDIAQPGVAGTRDSHDLRIRGTSFDTVGHSADWIVFNDVTSNAGASTLTIQSRIDAAAFANRLTVSDAGLLTVTNATVSGLTANSFVYSGTGGALSTTAAPTNGQLLIGSTSAAPVAAALTGTTNQVTVTNGAGSITLATPQNIHTAATPTFASLFTTAQISVRVDPYGAAAGNTSEVRFLELAASGTNYVGFKSADALAADVIWTLPNADGTNGQILQTNGSKVLSWASAPATAANPSASVGLTAVNGSAGTYMRSDAAPALSQSIAPTWTGLHIFNPGTTPSNVVLVDIAQPGVASSRDSHDIVVRGTSFDTVGHSADWKAFVDMTSNAAASTLTVQSRIDAAGYANRLLLTDAGLLTVTNATVTGLTANSFVYSGTGGALTTTSAPTNGQLLIGSTSAAPVAAALTGTANQITVTNGAGSITLATPQNIATASTPTFSGLIVGTGEAGTPGAGTVRGTNASGTDIAAAITTVAAGLGTGSGNAGITVLQASPSKLATGSTAHSSITILQVGNTHSGQVGLTGAWLSQPAQTYTDRATAASGTATNAVLNSFAQPTIAASNTSVITTNAATAYIADAPAAGTNMTLTNSYALWIDAGITRLDGDVRVGGVTLGSAGTVSAPGFGFTGDTDTGLYSSAANQLVLVTGGANRLGIVGNEIYLGNGDGGNPTSPMVLRGANAAGTSVTGATLDIKASVGTGTGDAGTISFWATSTKQPSGSTAHTLVTVLTIGNTQNTQVGLTGAWLSQPAQTYTDRATAASGTATNAVFNSFAQSTIAASNISVTTTHSATIYIAGAPAAGTNITLTNAYALWIDDGDVRLDGNVGIGFAVKATSRLDVNGPIATAYLSVSADTTLDGTHSFVAVDATAAARVITLPAAAGIVGRRYTIKKTDSSGNTVTIDGNGAETIDGAATKVISTQYTSHSLISTGSAWFIE